MFVLRMPLPASAARRCASECVSDRDLLQSGAIRSFGTGRTVCTLRAHKVDANLYVCAQHAFALQLDGYPDPFVEVQWRDTHARTRYINDTKDPSWQSTVDGTEIVGEAVTLWPQRAAKGPLPLVKFTVYDSDKLTAHDKLAEGELTLPSLNEEVLDQEHTVQLSGGGTLKVTISVNPVPKARAGALVCVV